MLIFVENKQVSWIAAESLQRYSLPNFCLYKASVWWLLASTWPLGKGSSVEADQVLHCVNCLADNFFSVFGQLI